MASFNRPGDQMGLKPASAYNNQGVASGGPSSSPYDWKNFFGNSKGNSPTNPYDPQRKPTWILPDAYSGTNDFLRKVIDFKVFLADNFYTTDLAPMEYTDRLDVQWNRWEFSPKFAGLVPERGVTRLVESRRSGGRATFERRGLGFLLTHGFMHTAEGRAHYQMNLRQIYESVVETNNFGVIYAYLTADKPALNWSAHHGTALGRNLQEILQNEVEIWDIFKRVEHGGDILDVIVADVMSKFQGEADTWIVAKKVGLWYTAIPEDKQKYWAGDRQRSINNVVDGTGAFRFFNSSTGSGARVFLVRQYHVDNQYQAGLDILKAPYQIGEHHIMADPNRNGDYSGYTSKWRSVMIFDEDSDTFREISLLMALDNCHRFDIRSGDLIKIDDSSYLPFNPGNFALPDQRDFLHYYDSGKPETCKLMGNIEHDANDLFDLIRTSRPQIVPKNSVLEGTDHKVMDPETILRKGLNALNIIESFEIDANNVASVRAFFNETITLNNARYPPQVNPRSTSQTLEYGSNPATGTLDIPTVEPGVFPLPPCFGSFPGFKAIAEMSRKGQATAQGYDSQLCKDVEEFVSFFDKFADNLSKVFVDCVFLKPRYASSWWRRPTPATVLFENLVGTYRNPVFLDVTDQDQIKIGRQAKNPIEGARAANLRPQNAGVNSDLLTPVASFRNTAQKVVDDISAARLGVTDTVTKIAEAAADATIISKTLVERIEEAKVRGILTFLVSQVRADTVLADSDTFTTFQQKLEAAVNPHIRFEAGNIPTIVTSVDETIASISKFVRSNKDAFRRSSSVDKQMKDIVAAIEIQGEIDPSSKDNEASNVELFGNAKAQTLRDAIDMNTNSRSWRRAPLIMTPGIFKNLINFADASLSVLPADPENPNNPISVASLARLTRLMQAEDQDTVSDVPASLKPNYINSQRVGSRMTNTSFSDVSKLSAYQSINYNMNVAGESTETATFRPSQSSALIGASMPGAGIRSSSRRPGRISHITDAEAEEEMELTAARNDVESNSRRIFASGVSDSTDKHILNAMLQSTMRAQFLGLEDNTPSDLDRIIGQVFLGTTTNKKAWVSLIRNNVLFPTDFLLSRPHARYQTYTAIKVKAGDSTAVTYMGNSHFTLGDNVATQTHLGAFTYYSSTVIFEPRNVFVVRNSFVEGYDGGMGTKFYEIGKYNPGQQKYGDEPLTNTKGGSLFAMMIPRGGFDLPSPMSITGRFTMFDRQIFSMNEEKLHYPTAFFYNKLWGFSDHSLGTLDINNMRYVNERTAPNGVTHEGHTLFYSPTARDFKRVRLSRGHWGSDVTYSGCGQVRRGAMKRFRIQDWSRDYAMV